MSSHFTQNLIAIHYVPFAFHALGANGRLPELPATRTHELLSILWLRLHSGDIDQGGRPARSQT